MSLSAGSIFVKAFILVSLLVWWLFGLLGVGVGLLFLSVQQSIGMGMVVGFGGWVLVTIRLTKHIMKCASEALIETLKEEDAKRNGK